MKKGIVTFVLWVVSLSSYSQCAMCKAAVESGNSTGNGSLANGLNSGILYLMFIPYLIMAVVGYFLYKQYKKKSEAKRA